MLVGRDAGASEALWELMFGAQAGAGRTGGFYLEAISGIDLALWDLRGKAAGQPVHRLLGGPVRAAVPVYASPIPFLPNERVRRARTVLRGRRLQRGETQARPRRGDRPRATPRRSPKRSTAAPPCTSTSTAPTT